MANNAGLKEIEAASLFGDASPEELLEAAARKIAARRVEEARANLPALEEAANQASVELTLAEEALKDARTRLANARAAYAQAERALKAAQVEVDDLVPDILARMKNEGPAKPARAARSGNGSGNGSKAAARAATLWECEDHPVRPQDLSHFAFVHLHKFGGTLLREMYGEPDGHALEVTDPAGTVHHVRAVRAE